MTMQASSITGAAVAGVSVGGTDVTLGGLALNDSRTALRVERGANGLMTTGLTITGGQDGVVAAAGTGGVVLQDMTVDGVINDAVRSSSQALRVVGGRITGGATGIAIDAPTTITGTWIGLADQGIRTTSTGSVRADNLDVNTVSVGINVEKGSDVLLTGSRVHALEAVRGTLQEQGLNDMSLPPLNFLGAIGIPLVVIALTLQAFAAWRGRRFGDDVRRPVPLLDPVRLPEMREAMRDATAARVAARSSAV
jgi:hypothetical protein